MGGENKKGYNNPNDWEKIEKKDGANTRIIDLDAQIIDAEEIENVEDLNNFRDGDDITSQDNISDLNDNEGFNEVIELTQYDDKNLPANNEKLFVAEYKDINTVELSKKHTEDAKSFVNKITKFILDFNDVALSEDHKKYLKQVGNLQLQHLGDLLYLVDVNKQMLNNIIARVNATQAEDYSIINSYNNLANQHLKLIKELQNTYRSIPNVLKKMKADVLCNQELSEGNNENEGGQEVITSEFGSSQFNTSKQLLKSMIEKRNQKKALSDGSTEIPVEVSTEKSESNENVA